MITLFWALPLSVFLGCAVNYAADILPLEGRSKKPVCPHCSTPCDFMDYLFKLKCRSCGQKRNMRHWLIPLFSLLLPILLVLCGKPEAEHFTWLSLFYISCCHVLLVIFVIDLEHKVIYYSTCIAALLVIGPSGFIRTVVFLQRNWAEQMIGLLVGAGICAGIYGLGILFVKLINIHKQEKLDDVAFGFGDVILGGLLGLWIGFPGIVLGMILAILLGGMASLVFIIVKKIRRTYRPLTAIPYAPFMIITVSVLVLYAYFLK